MAWVEKGQNEVEGYATGWNGMERYVTWWNRVELGETGLKEAKQGE